MAWLAGYTKRIKLTIDNTKVDSTLSNFPVTVFFTSTQGEEIFTEFDADSDYMKCAFTTSDGETQLYAEKEAFIPSQYPPAQSDTYVKSTTKCSTNYWAYYATDPTKSLTGSDNLKSWMSAITATTNQRFHIDLGSTKLIKKIYYENAHNTGADTDTGVQNFTFWGSNTGDGTFNDLVYANDEGWTQLTISQSTFDQHTGSNVADPKYITVTNTTAYRYYAFKFADNYGHVNYMGIRRIELQCDEAIYHVKVTSISSSAGTDIYYYYNNSIADNTTYIGAINTTAGGHAWDDNFKAVYHMVDATTSTVVDSTVNNEDATKKAANEPIEATGKVGQGQDFDGTDDYINRTTNSLTPATGTFEMLFNTDNVADGKRMFSEIGGGGYFNFMLTGTDDKFKIRVHDGSAWAEYEEAVSVSTWYHALVAFDTSEARFYINGVLKHTDATFNGLFTDGTGIKFGCGRNNTLPYDGKLDEARVSGVARSTAWAKATYNTLWDTFLTYGSEELAYTSQYPTAQSDTYVKVTTKYSTSYWQYFSTDPTKSLTGGMSGNQWLSGSGTYNEQRFHIDLGSAKIIRRIYYENSHNSGTHTSRGIQNFTFQGSNTGSGTFDDLVYANDGGWTNLTVDNNNKFDQHTGSDVADPKYITVTNTVAYRYYAIKIVDNYGTTITGVRRIELQTEDGYSGETEKLAGTSVSATTASGGYLGATYSMAGTAICAVSTTGGALNATLDLAGTSAVTLATSSALNLSYPIVGTSAAYVNAVAGHLGITLGLSGTSVNTLCTGREKNWVDLGDDTWVDLGDTTWNNFVAAPLPVLIVEVKLAGTSVTSVSTIGAFKSVLNLSGTSVNAVSAVGALTLGTTEKLSGTVVNKVSTTAELTLGVATKFSGTSISAISTIGALGITLELKGTSVNAFTTTGAYELAIPLWTSLDGSVTVWVQENKTDIDWLQEKKSEITWTH